MAKFNFSQNFSDKLKAAGYDPAKIEYGSVLEPRRVNEYKDEEGKVIAYGYYDEDGKFNEAKSVYSTEPNWENSGAETFGLYDTGKKGIVYEGRPVTVEVDRTPDNVITYVTLDYDPNTQQPVPKVSFDRVASGGSFFGDIFGEALNLATSDAGKMLALAAGAGVFTPAAAGTGALTGYDAALADLAASAPAFTPEAAAIAAPAIVPELTGYDAALADLAASAPAIAPEIIAAPVAAELTGVDAALADLANSTPAFTGAELSVPAASGITLKGALDTARAGLLVNALTGDPLGLNDTGGGTSAPTGFAQVPIPEDWKSPTYTYSPVQNVTFEDLFPGVSLQGTQWQNMPQAQTFNEMFASGRQTPMGSPVDINQIVGSILGQSATS